MDERFWDERYRSRARLFSGEPGGPLVAEAAGLAPGRALDLGCGEGGDAIWLAGRGWLVTGIDIAPTALERAASAADAAGVADRVVWRQADLTVTAPAAGAFELVSAQYFPLPRRCGDAAVRGLLGAVAPGGTLLVAGHDPAEAPAGAEREWGRYWRPDEMAAVLGEEWSVEVDEVRPRTAAAPPGTAHTRDAVVRARRLG